MRRRAFLPRALAAAVAMAARAPLHAAPGSAAEIAATGLARPDLKGFDTLMTDFLRAQRAPGAAIAVSADGRLVYARGFGLASREPHTPVQPTALFRIASISKPITAVAVLQLVERGELALGASAWEVLRLPQPRDARWKKVTVLHLLQHTGGWDREARFDPMFRSFAIARELRVPPPPQPRHIIQYMLRQPLDFEPGSRFAYSNFGYCLLGRLIERVAGLSYERYVGEEVLAPLGIHGMRLGRTLRAQRAPGEVTYHADGRTAPALPGAAATPIPRPYGAWSLESMDAHGGWLASAPALVRFACAFDVPERCRILSPASIALMWARPDGAAGYEADGRPRPVYYGCGWRVRPLGRPGVANVWHTGSFDGTSTLLVRRHDGRNWAVLFNARNAVRGGRLSDVIDPLVHGAADAVRHWPADDLFPGLLR